MSVNVKRATLATAFTASVSKWHQFMYYDGVVKHSTDLMIAQNKSTIATTSVDLGKLGTLVGSHGWK